MSAWAAGEANRGDRATALVEDIFCDKIRGRSYREGNTVRRYVPRGPGRSITVRPATLPRPLARVSRRERKHALR
jgi:hypothetical protein